MTKWKWIAGVITVILFMFISGFRFTALNAATSNTFISNDYTLLEEYDAGSATIFLFKSDKEQLYRTVVSKKYGLLYRSNVSTFIPYRTDSLQTIGGISYKNNKKEFTILVIESSVEEVTYIEAGLDYNLERKQISKGERIYFLFPFSKQINFLYPIAFNKEGEKLYYYGYPENSNFININEDLRWHKIDK